MRFARKAALVFLLVFGACLSSGCSDDSTGPENSSTSPGRHLWSKRFGDGYAQEACAVAVDAMGNVIVAGTFAGTADFGGGPLASDAFDLFIAKFGPDGSHLWSKKFGGGYPTSVAIDASGNAIVTGYFYSPLDFGGGVLTSAGEADVFIAKFDSEGAGLWSKRFGDAGRQVAHAVAIDASGNAIVTGTFMGIVDFGGGGLVSAGEDNYDLFVVKFGPEGGHLWSKRFGDGSASQEAGSVAVDTSGNVILAGNFYGTVDFGGGVHTSAGEADVFITKFDPEGAHLWSKRFGDGSFQFAVSVAIDASGSVVVTGTFDGTLDFGGVALTGAGTGYSDIFVVKFASEGTYIWSRRFGDGDGHSAQAIAADASGNVILAGCFDGTVNFGGSVLTSTGFNDVFVAKFASDGDHLWSKRFGDEESQEAQSVAIDASGSVVFTGCFYGSVDFGGGVLTSAGSWDAFVAKFGP